MKKKVYLNYLGKSLINLETQCYIKYQKTVI